VAISLGLNPILAPDSEIRPRDIIEKFEEKG